jgi:hypothetical protein
MLCLLKRQARNVLKSKRFPLSEGCKYQLLALSCNAPSNSFGRPMALSRPTESKKTVGRLLFPSIGLTLLEEVTPCAQGLAKEEGK